MSEQTNSACIVRRATAADIPAAAKVHELAFPRQTYSKEWIDCVFKSFPKSQLFVAEEVSHNKKGETSKEIVGLIFWTEKSGFRKDAVVELEQIAVHPDKRSNSISSIGNQLIFRSVVLVAEKIAERGAKLGHILGNTRVDNRSLRLYQKFGAQSILAVPGLFTADEVFLVVHNVDASIEAWKKKNLAKAKNK